MRHLVYTPRPADERAAFDWWLARRNPKWSVTLHKHRCSGDDRDAELMYKVEVTRCQIAPVKPGGYRCATVHSIMRGAQLATGEVRFP